MYHQVFVLYEFLLTTVNDHGGQITAMLWQWLCKLYGINIKFSLSHHPETDGQTKSANRVMKNYLYAYIAYTQDNWVDYLSMAKLATSNHINTSIGMTLFFANHEFHSCIGIEPLRTFESEDEQKPELLAADKIVTQQEKMMSFLQDQLAWSQDEQTQFANKICQPHPEYKIGNKVYVNARHFASEKDKKLLDLKNARP